jgi:hypothetical protein
MTSKTDDLIADLARGLEPVRPLASPGRRAALWFVGAALYLAGLTFALSGFRFPAASSETAFIVVQMIGVAAGVLAARAAFASVVPGYSERVLVWPAAATALWFAAMIAVSLGNGGQPIFAAHHEWLCVAVILLGGSPLVAAIAIGLRKGAPLHPPMTAVLAAAAVGLLANFSACLARPHAADAATLVWHVGAVAALALVCVVGARLVLRWPSRASRSGLEDRR